MPLSDAKRRATINYRIRQKAARTYLCAECNIAICTLDGLARHMLSNRHVPAADVYQYECILCKFKSPIKYRFTQHCRTTRHGLLVAASGMNDAKYTSTDILSRSPVSI